VAAKSAAVAFCICCCVVIAVVAAAAAATHKLSPHNGKVIEVIQFYTDI